MKQLITLIALLIIMTLIIYIENRNFGLPFKIVYALVFALCILALFNLKKKEKFELVDYKYNK